MAIFANGGLKGQQLRSVLRQMRLTKWAMVAERAAGALWPVWVVLCVVLAAALLGGFGALGPVGHRIALGIALAALVVALIWSGYRFRKPTDAEIAARLDEGDRRRPLAALSDDLAVGADSVETTQIWRTFRTRARDAAAALRARAPDLRLSGQDRWGLRLLAPVLLIGGLIATGANFPDRIAAVTDPAPLTPPVATVPERQAAAEAWAVPPAYTGQPTVYLTRAATDPGKDAATTGAIRIPQGAQLTIRVTDFLDLPTLSGGALAGIEGFTSLGGGLSEAQGLITQSGALTVMAGEKPLATWQIEMIPDTAPVIDFDGVPEATVTRGLGVSFEASDDYGIAAAWAEIAPDGHDPENAKGLPLPVISFELPLPVTGDAREVSDTAIRDFTSHPWAGAEVQLKLLAEDGAEQQGVTEPLTITLPARRFGHPLARALVEQRRELAMDYGEADRVLDVLQAVTRRPDTIFRENSGAFLITRTAIRRLARAIGTDAMKDTAPEVIDYLWQAALALEDGDLSSALEQLRQAQENLRQALQNGTEEDIRKAMEQLRAAMNEYLQQLAQQQRNNPNQQQGQMDPNQMLSQQDLQDMLDQLQQNAENGLRDQAQQMLSELSQLLENLRSAQSQPGQQGQNQQAMQELQDMIQRQRDLADRTFDELRQRRREQQGQQQPGGQRGQQPGQQQPGWGEGEGRGDEHGSQGQRQGQGRGEGQQPGQQRPGQGGGLANQQEQLRQKLDELSRGIGSNDAAKALEDAVRSMGEARDDLKQGQNSDAVRDQMEALDRLNDGAEALAQQMQNGQGEQSAQGTRRGEGRGNEAEETDPFDRPTSSYGALDGKSTKVPDRALIDRARELMRELRRRAADPSRPDIELEYLDRLMERF